ncbi:MAG: FAD-dependent oxidoreductase [Pseudomonadota bacterium]
MKTDVAIIGAGIIGLWSAVELARSGRTVLVLERETTGGHASPATAGGVRSLNRDPAEIPLARAALPLWEGAAEQLGEDVGFRAAGQIRVAESDEAMAKLEARAALTKSLGYNHEELIGANTLRAMEPELSPHFRGAITVRDDGYADPARTMGALHRAAVSAGVEIKSGVEVSAVVLGAPLTLETSDGAVEAAAVVNAAGAWGAEVAESVNETVPLTPTALQMTMTVPVPKFVTSVMGTEGRKLSLKQPPSGHVVIGGGYEGSIERDRMALPNTAGIDENFANAVSLFPHLAPIPIARNWAGIEGMVADGLPVVSPSQTTPGLIHAFGFSGHGYALSPVIGRVICEIVNEMEPSVPIAAFDIERFAQLQAERLSA